MPENNTAHFTRKMALYGYMFQKYKQREKKGIKKNQQATDFSYP